MNEATVDVCCEHVGHGLDGEFTQGGTVTQERLLVDGTQGRPLHLVQGMDQVHECLEVPGEKREGGREGGRGSHVIVRALRGSHVVVMCSEMLLTSGTVFPFPQIHLKS